MTVDLSCSFEIRKTYEDAERLLLRRLLGTPSEESWPGVSQLPDYKPTFPQWSAQSLTQHIPNLDATGLDFLHVRASAF